MTYAHHIYTIMYTHNKLAIHIILTGRSIISPTRYQVIYLGIVYYVVVFSFVFITWQWCSLCRGCQSLCTRATCSGWRPAGWHRGRAECGPVPRCRRVAQCPAASVWCKRCAVRRPGASGKAQRLAASRASSRRGWRTRPPSDCDSQPICTHWPSGPCWKWAAGCGCCTASGRCGGGCCRAHPNASRANAHRGGGGRTESARRLAGWRRRQLRPLQPRLPDGRDKVPGDNRPASLGFPSDRPGRRALPDPYRPRVQLFRAKGRSD